MTKYLLLMIWVSLGSTSHAASLGLFSTPDCSSCNLTILIGQTATFYINVDTDGLGMNEMLGAEFRITGLPTSWTATSVPIPAGSSVNGDPMAAGTNIAFPSGIGGSCLNLFRVEVTATTSESDIRLDGGVHASPSNPLIACSRLTGNCGSPCTEIRCVSFGSLFVNSSSECTVSVVAKPWSSIKRLFD